MDEDPAALGVGDRTGAVGLALGEVSVAVLDHDDGGIDEDADGERESAERHDVRRDAEEVDGDEGDEHRDGQRDDHDERGAEVKEEDKDDQADDDRFFNQGALQGVDGVVDETGAIVRRFDFDARWKRGCDLAEPGFYAVNHIEGVLALAHDDDTADGFALAVPVGNAIADIGAEAYGAQVANQDRSAVLAADGDGFKIAG